MVGAQFPKAGVQVLQGLFLRSRVGLAGKNQRVAFRFERGAHHAFIVSALISTSRVEVGDADIGGPLHHALIGSDHAAEANGRRFQPGLAKWAVSKFWSGGRTLRIAWGGQPGSWQNETRSKKTSPRGRCVHACSF